MAEIRRVHFDKDVYEPSDDSFTLVDALTSASAHWPQQRPTVVLELGSGSGYVICSIALLLQRKNVSAHCMAVDVNPKAVSATQITLAAHGVQNVEVICTDMTRPLLHRLSKSVDLLVFNPPYVPTPDAELHRKGIAQAWAGGQRGRVVIDQFLPAVDELLSPDGELFLVTVDDNGPQEILDHLAAQGLAGEVALRRQADEERLSILRCWRPQNKS